MNQRIRTIRRRLVAAAAAAGLALALSPVLGGGAPSRAAAIPKDKVPTSFDVKRVAVANLDAGSRTLWHTMAVDRAGDLYALDGAGSRVDIYDASRFAGASGVFFLGLPDRTFDLGRAKGAQTITIAPDGSLVTRGGQSPVLFWFSPATVRSGQGTPSHLLEDPAPGGGSMAFDRDGDLWLLAGADVLGFDPAHIAQDAGPAWRLPDIGSAVSMAVDGNGTIWAARGYNQKFDGYKASTARQPVASAVTHAPDYTVSHIPGMVLDANTLSSDSHGNLYIPDGNVVRVLSASSVAQNNATSQSAYLGRPDSVPTAHEAVAAMVDGAGNLYAIDHSYEGQTRISYWRSATLGTAGGTTDPAQAPGRADAEATALSSPVGLSQGPDGTLYVADASEKAVVALATGSLQGGAPAASGRIQFASAPHMLRFDPSGNLWASTGNGLSRFDKAHLPAAVPSDSQGNAKPDGTFGERRLYPQDFAFAPNGDLYAGYGYDILAYHAATVAQNGTTADRTMKDVGITTDLTFGPDGTMYAIADDCIWEFPPSQLAAAAPKGTRLTGFQGPIDMTVDGYGNLYVTEQAAAGSYDSVLRVYAKPVAGLTHLKAVATVPGMARATHVLAAGTTLWVTDKQLGLMRVDEKKFVDPPKPPQYPKTDDTKVLSIRAGQKTLVLVKGKKARLPILAYHEDGVATTAFTWARSKKKVATVSSTGLVRAKKPGKTVLTATLGGKKAKVKVTVLKKATAGTRAKSLKAKLKRKLRVGQTSFVKASWSPKKAAGIVVKFSSTKKKVATVDRAGRIVALKKGKTVIKVKVRGAIRKVKVKVVK